MVMDKMFLEDEPRPWTLRLVFGSSARCRNVGGGSKTPLIRRPRFRREKREGVGLLSTSAATWVPPLEANERHLANLPA
ncbi:unnamed protein product [Sphagnum jensenii]|uniref:Uncharacterized protein n=1 Tax=Sphagnum jensenii TaxID=128206 RepID=A0ABP1AHZ5_9BRYO